MSTPKQVIIDKALVSYGWLDADTDPDADYEEMSAMMATFCEFPVTVNCIKERIATHRDYQSRLEKLIALPVIEQRTPIWYEMRKNLITASDLAQALGVGKFGTQKDLIIKKCGYKEEAPFNSTLPPLKWGTMFEPVATALYAYRNRVTVHEFGLVRHPTVLHFGASPDGITELGIMVEIKCPYRRKITGEIPEQYYYQIQGQLDVCDLEECDYVECEFSEYDNIECYEDDVDPGSEGRLTRSRMNKGVIIEILPSLPDCPFDEPLPPSTCPSVYLYSPPNMSHVEIRKWLDKELSNIKRHKIVYYRLDTYLSKRVFRNRDFMEEKLVELESIWGRIKAYKADLALYQKEIESVVPPKRGRSRSASVASNGGAAPVSIYLNVGTGASTGSRLPDFQFDD